jgi:hypothetical protein
MMSLRRLTDRPTPLLEKIINHLSFYFMPCIQKKQGANLVSMAAPFLVKPRNAASLSCY